MAQQPPVVIVATIAQSGTFARASRAQVTAYQLAEEITNEEGGVLGRLPLTPERVWRALQA